MLRTVMSRPTPPKPGSYARGSFVELLRERAERSREAYSRAYKVLKRMGYIAVRPDHGMHLETRNDRNRWITRSAITRTHNLLAAHATGNGERLTKRYVESLTLSDLTEIKGFGRECLNIIRPGVLVSGAPRDLLRASMVETRRTPAELSPRARRTRRR